MTPQACHPRAARVRPWTTIPGSGTTWSSIRWRPWAAVPSTGEHERHEQPSTRTDLVWSALAAAARRSATRPGSADARPMDQRVGDVERSAVCEELSRQYAAGRLTDEELELRVGAAMGARTRGDLHPLLVDLPPDAPPPVPAGPPRPVTPVWSTVDVLALITLVGTVAVASLGALGVTASGAAELGVGLRPDRDHRGRRRDGADSGSAPDAPLGGRPGRAARPPAPAPGGVGLSGPASPAWRPSSAAGWSASDPWAPGSAGGRRPAPASVA